MKESDPNNIVECSDCGDLHREEDRRPQQRSVVLRVTVCPKCGCASFYESDEDLEGGAK